LHRTVAEAKATVSSSEFTHWQARYQLEPFGDQRNDMRMGEALATYLNFNKSKDSERAAKEWFMGYYLPQAEAKRQTPEEVDAEIDAALRAFGL
jgi:hypothetical protein